MKTKRTVFLSLCLIVAMLLSCSSCVLRVSAEELSEGYSRKEKNAGEVTDAFQTAMADFSMELFRGLVTKDGENDLVSPLSAILCLSMLANGTDGETRAQMEEAFGLKVEELNEALYAYTSSLYTADDCKVHIADSIWFRDEKDRLHVNADFLQTNADWYDAQIYAAPFDNSTLRDINNWCKHYTDGMIDRMIDRIDPETVMYLINALTFDAKWADEYEKKDVRGGIFHNYSGTDSNVQMLSSSEHVYLESENAIGFAKNYAGNHYSIVALLPKEGIDLYEYIGTLNGNAWKALWDSRTSASVDVKMPEFTYAASMDLNDVLQQMGIVDLFGANADLSKLGYSEAGNLYCSEVCQKTFIQVDRNGTKAAAITWGTNKAAAAFLSLTVILDRPFVYAIVDNENGLPLFVGAVSEL